MEQLLSAAEERLALLKRQREDLSIQVIAYDGAIQDAEWFRDQIKKRLTPEEDECVHA